MKEITVVNKNKEPSHIYIGKGTALANPFTMYEESQRDEVCDKYSSWFYRQVDEPMFLDKVEDKNLTRSPQESELIAIFVTSFKEEVNLGCSCKTDTEERRCHGDTVKNFLENKQEEFFK